MKRHFGFQDQRRGLPSDSSNSLESHVDGRKLETGANYHIRKKDLRNIHKAAFRGNVQEVQRLLLLGPERVNLRDRRRRTPLHLACACGHVGVVTLLTDRKCKLNLRDDKNRTALMKAVQCQEEECVSLLLERGADPNIKDVDGFTALHHAVLGHNESIATKLLQHQADLEARNKCGFTPLLLAVNENNQEMVEFLIGRNANVHATDNLKRTALMLAINDKSSKTVRLLLQLEVNVFAVDIRGWTAEVYARFKGLKINHQLIYDTQKERIHEILPESSKLVDEHSEKDPASSLCCKAGIDESQSSPVDKDCSIDPKEEETMLAIVNKENGMCVIETTPQAQTVKVSAFGLKEKEDKELPWDSEVTLEQNDMQRPHSEDHNHKVLQHAISTSDLWKQEVKDLALTEINSESIPERCQLKYVDPSLFSADQSRTHKLTGDVEADLRLVMTSEDMDNTLDGRENDNPHVYQSHENGKEQLPETAILKLEIEAFRRRNQEMQKKYFEDIACIKQKNDHLEKTMQINEEKLSRAILQYKDQINVLTAENKMLSSKLKKEKKSKGKLETELESYSSRLVNALSDLEQRETSEKDLKVAFLGVKDEWFSILDQMNSDISSLKDNMKILSQQLSQAESEFNSLESEFRHTREALRDRTLALESVQRDLSQSQHQEEEMEDMDKRDEGRMNACVGKLEFQEERGPHLQSENVLFENQLDDPHHKCQNNDKKVINTQDQLEYIIKLLQAQSEQLDGFLKHRKKELINDVSPFNERLYQHKNMKAEGEMNDVTAKQQAVCSECLRLVARNQSLQQELLSVTGIQRMFEKLQDEQQELRQELMNLQSHMENFASQENVHQLNEHNNGFIRNQWELRLKDLESEISRVKIYEDFSKIELNKYKEAYLEELEIRISLESKINTCNERLAEIGAGLLLKEQENSFLSIAPKRPVLEPACFGGFNVGSSLSRNPAPRENLVLNMSQTSNDSVDASCSENDQE